MLADSPEMSTASTIVRDGEVIPKENFVIIYPDGDIILVSSDNKWFKLHKLLLSLSSPVFAGMLAMPQPADGQNNPSPIYLSEDAETLLALLDILYPNRKPAKEVDFTLLRKIGVVAQKYQIDVALDYLEQSLWVALRDKDPLRVYALASSHDMQHLAATAAFELLSRPMNHWSDPIPPEMQDVSGAAVLKLQAYLTRRRSLIDSIIPAEVTSSVLIGPHDGVVPWGMRGCMQCPRGVYKGKCLPLWFITLLMRVREAYIVRPRGSSVNAVVLFGNALQDMAAINSNASNSQCLCSTNGSERLISFLKRLADLLEARLEQVILHIKSYV